VDSSGEPYISYSTYSTSSGLYAVRHAQRDAEGWHTGVVESGLQEPIQSCLALDATGCPHISYGARGDLRYASLIPSGGEPSTTQPGRIRLISVVPNPFRTSTELRWELGTPGLVQASVFDLLGRKVAKVAEGPAEVGEQRLTWRPVGLPSGAYVLRLTLNGTTAVQPVILAK
jgi:hypothetical protein